MYCIINLRLLRNMYFVIIWWLLHNLYNVMICDYTVTCITLLFSYNYVMIIFRTILNSGGTTLKIAFVAGIPLTNVKNKTMKISARKTSKWHPSKWESQLPNDTRSLNSPPEAPAGSFSASDPTQPQFVICDTLRESQPAWHGEKNVIRRSTQIGSYSAKIEN